MRRWMVLLLLPGLLLVPGCKRIKEVVVSREALGTVVSITAYGEDEDAVRKSIDDAFAAIADVQAQTDAYNAASAISQLNANPYTATPLPPDASAIMDEVLVLGVSADFSPTLLGVTRLYHFSEGGTVPNSKDLALALEASRAFVRPGDGTGYFQRIAEPDPRLDAGGELAPGVDLGGAAKGLALDRARDVLKKGGKVTGALISSGSSTVTFGTKPNGGAWKIGIEDPRDPERIVATFAFEGDGALSTSGDYQQYFEKDGRRYHHILHPATGLPAAGIRSLTVAGTSLTGLDSDILSTAMFVMGPDDAESFARDRGVALFAVNAEGRALVVPAPAKSGLDVTEKAKPRK